MSKEKLTKQEVEKIGKLASFELEPEEMQKFQIWLTEALDYIEVLKELDVSDTVETSQVTGLINIWRQDEAQVSLSQEKALANAPRQQDGYFRVASALHQ